MVSHTTREIIGRRWDAMEEKRRSLEMDMHTTRIAAEMVGRKEIELADTALAGLSIRVRKAAATWCLRGRLGRRQSIWTPGDIGDIPVSAARDLGNEAKKLLKRGVDPREWLAGRANGGPTARSFDPMKDGMTIPRYGGHGLRGMVMIHAKRGRTTKTGQSQRDERSRTRSDLPWSLTLALVSLQHVQPRLRAGQLAADDTDHKGQLRPKLRKWLNR